MSSFLPSALLFSPNIVGILHTEACLEKLRAEENSLPLAGIDLLEVRLDSLPDSCSIPLARIFHSNWSRGAAQLCGDKMDEDLGPGLHSICSSSLNSSPTQSTSGSRRPKQNQCETFLREWPLPIIATARDPREGGQNNLSLKERQGLLTAALSWATILDIELASIKEFASIIAMARAQERKVILSYHNFQTTPELKELHDLAARASDAGATILKVATMISSKNELARLLEFQQIPHPLPVATMGMGALGKISRLILPAAGSALAYGWLYEPLAMIPATTQWPARELAEKINHIRSGT